MRHAGPSNTFIGILPNRSCSSYHASTSPGTPVDSGPNRGTRAPSPSTRAMSLRRAAAAVERVQCAVDFAYEGERVAAEAAPRHLDHALHRRAGDDGIDGTAAVAQHVARDLGRQAMTRGDCAVCPIRELSAKQTTATASISTSMSAFFSRLTKNDVRAGSVVK